MSQLGLLLRPASSNRHPAKLPARDDQFERTLSRNLTRNERGLRPTAADFIALQSTVGNAVVNRLVASRFATPPASVRFATGALQREFEDQDKVAEGAVGVMRGPAAKPETSAVAATKTTESGLLDGEISSNVEPHAFSDGGKVKDGTWHHTGGDGGKGNENTGEATLTAPVFETKAGKAGKPAKAWIRSGTGKVKVKRSWNGVTTGDQGVYTSPPPGGGPVWMSPRGQARVAQHEREHVKKTKEIHDLHIKPLEKRIATYRGIGRSTKKGADEATAQAALEAEIDWNESIRKFADEDTAANAPMATVDTDDMAKADFYRDYPTSAKFKTDSGCEIYEGVGASKRGKT